jgi:hypothetical protein
VFFGSALIAGAGETREVAGGGCQACGGGGGSRSEGGGELGDASAGCEVAVCQGVGVGERV